MTTNSKEYRLRNHQKIIEYMRIWRIENREKIREYNNNKRNNKENRMKDERQLNSFQKKKDTDYLMDICLNYKDRIIYIDVFKGDTSYDLAHKYFKKVNI